MFAQMMIPHHEQAVEMSELVPARSQSSEIINLAKEIQSEQGPEIIIMKNWLSQAGADLEMGHTMHMSGMLTDIELEKLSNASGLDFDRLFLEGMIKHHEGAIEMARPLLKSPNEEVRLFAESLTESQNAQITEMVELSRLLD